MLDIKFIIENKDLVQKAAQEKQIDLNVGELITLASKRKKLLQDLETINKERNFIATSLKGRKPDDKEVKKGRELKSSVAKLEKELIILNNKYENLMYLVPQIPEKNNPIGDSKEGNVQIKTWGKIPKFNFKIKDHIELGTKLDLIDLDKGVKVHGFRGYFLKNEAVAMHLGLMMFALSKMQKRGFTLMINPSLVREFALVGSGHFPFGKEEVFKIENDNLFLAGTAEPSLLAYYSDEVIASADLPIKLCGLSPCFRSEVGSYGKDTKGLYRIHEFLKVEQMILCANDYNVSQKYFNEMKEIAEEILQDLKLPYRIVQTCTGDMGAGKYRMDDIETWMPGRGNYGETHSCSNLGDWQARRLNIKYLNEKGDKNLVHTLNNTVVASPRILIAILENYQQADGSVEIPKVLQPFVGKKVIK